MARCFLIGETALLTQCGDLLARRGFTLAAVVSEDPVVWRWAESKGAPLCRRVGDATSFATNHSFEFLLSIINPCVLPEALLSQASIGAVNFHDSLLPSYAGSHAAVYVLIHGDDRTGVTWHLMGQQADAGDILVQQPVPVTETDTTAILYSKCAMTAFASFGSLIAMMRTGALTGRPQSEGPRSFFYRYRRPTCATVLDLNQPVQVLDRLVRALTFGTLYNPLGLPKLLTPDFRTILVNSVQKVGPASEPTGTVLSIGPQQITVASAESALEFGLTQALPEKLAPGYLLPTFQPTAEEIEFDHRSCKAERAVLGRARSARAIDGRFSEPRPAKGAPQALVAADWSDAIRAAAAARGGEDSWCYWTHATEVSPARLSALYSPHIPWGNEVPPLEGAAPTTALLGCLEMRFRLAGVWPEGGTAVLLSTSTPAPEGSLFPLQIHRSASGEFWLHEFA